MSEGLAYSGRPYKVLKDAQGDCGIFPPHTRLKAYCTTVRLSVIADLGEALLEWKNLLALVLVCVGIWLVTRDAPAPKESAPSATPAK